VFVGVVVAGQDFGDGDIPQGPYRGCPLGPGVEGAPGVIGTPCSVSTRQIGATAKRSLWLAMNSQTRAVVSDVSAGRFPARRKTLPP